MSQPRLVAAAYTVAWIAALPIESAAAAEMLDNEHQDPRSHGNNADQYIFGQVGDHNVVMACLPSGQMGTSSAAAVATRVTAMFPSIKFILLVGIGGGVPSASEDVRLGDVVVGHPHLHHSGVVQYDFGKTGPNGKTTRTGFFNGPPNLLLNAMAKLRTNHYRKVNNVSKHLSAFDQLPLFSRSTTGPDILYKATYHHVGGECYDDCSKEMAIKRPDRGHEDVVIHYGTIASGNQVMKDGVTRDRLSTELGGVLCFEMEAAGIVNLFPSMVIRGICDYADSHKNKRWQPYAAATAAAVAKELLLVTPTETKTSTERVTSVESKTKLDMVAPAEVKSNAETSVPTRDKANNELTSNEIGTRYRRSIANVPLIPDLILLSKLETRFQSKPRCTIHFNRSYQQSALYKRTFKEEIWQQVRLVGAGAFATIVLERCVRGDQEGNSRAVKTIQKRTLEFAGYNSYYNELEAMVIFSQPKYQERFVKLHGWYEDLENIYVAMEYISNHDLAMFCHESPLSEIEVQQITVQILEGLIDMHEHSFFHGDIKPDNILVVSTGPEWRVKLADFGISGRTWDEIPLMGTLGFSAPEALGLVDPESVSAHPCARDIWALATTAFFLLTREMMFESNVHLTRYLMGTFDFPAPRLLEKGVSEQGCDFISWLVQVDPEHRPGAKECLQHPWLKHLTESSDIPIDWTLDLSTLSLADTIAIDEVDSSSPNWTTGSWQATMDATEFSMGTATSKAKEPVPMSMRGTTQASTQEQPAEALAESIFEQSSPHVNAGEEIRSLPQETLREEQNAETRSLEEISTLPKPRDWDQSHNSEASNSRSPNRSSRTPLMRHKGGLGDLRSRYN